MNSTNLISTDWLNKHLNDADVVVLHTSYYLGVPGHSPAESYMKGHIPGARLFDIDEVCDHSNPLPHMIPDADFFAGCVGALGIANDSHVVVYDDGGVMPAFRVWWTFKVFGHEKVSVLDGGLMKWANEGKPIIQDAPEIERTDYKAEFKPDRVTDKAGILNNLDTKACEVLDARGPGRFTGAEQDPRPGVKSGHIPGSKNLFFRSLFNEDGTLKDKATLKATVNNLGLNPDKPVITTCGSGVTACILYFALDEAGVPHKKVYDGSWAEWSTSPDTPVDMGEE